MKKIVTIGGGGGHSKVLEALKNITDIQITGICPSTDSGGSTGILQKEYDAKGYGDLTKCIATLSKDNSISKKLLSRYKHGPFTDHSIKNLLFFTLEQIFGENDALDKMGDIFKIKPHKVIPVTNERTELCAKLKIGNEIFGETNIDTIAKSPLWNPNAHSIVDVYLKPDAKASSETLESIEVANNIIICPGDLYSSIIPVLLPKGINKSFLKTKGKIILILNLMTKRGETDNYTAKDFIDQIEKRIGKKVDTIICNDKRIPKNILVRYSLESKVELDSRNYKDKRFIFAPLAKINEKNEVVTDHSVLTKLFLKNLK